MTDHAQDAPLQTTVTSFDVLEALRDADGASVSELASQLGMAKSTVHRHLRTLHRLKYIVEEDGEFYLAYRFLELAHAARKRTDSHRLVREKVHELAAETGERAQFVAAEHGYGICLYRASGEHAVQTAPEIGSRMPLHATAAGKAILAFGDEYSVEDLAQDGLHAATEETITNASALRAELDDVRDRGYAVNRDEHISSLTAFGAPVYCDDASLAGAISISGPTNRFEDDGTAAEVVSLLRGAVNELELNITHSLE